MDIGCGKGYFLYDFLSAFPNSKVYGLDISQYALDNSKTEIKPFLRKGHANNLPFQDDFFDLVISINTLHEFEILI